MDPRSSGLLGQVESEARAAVVLPQQSLAGLLGLDARLPDFDNARYLEYRLGTDTSGQLDYLMSLTPLQADALARELPVRGLDGPGMAAVKRLAESWSTRGPAALRAIPIAWLEFDDVAHQEHPSASVCVCIAPSYRNPYQPVARRNGVDVLETVVESVRAIEGRDLDETRRSLIQRCIDRLPDGASWIHLSMMTARRPEQLKLYGVFPSAALPRYLRDIEWPGTLTTVAQFLRRYQALEPTSDTAYVDLPLRAFDGEANAGLGLCFSQQQLGAVPDRPATDPGRAAVLKALARDGLCTGDQIAALTRWPTPGGSTASLDERGEAVNRWLDIKVVYGDARPLLAKAYLGFARRRPKRAGAGLA